MHSLLQRFKGGSDEPEPRHQTPDPPVKRSRAKVRPAPKDPNIPRKRLQVNQKCLYERRLPGKAYISAHVNRLQHGYYKSNALHEPIIDNLFFVSVHFVFHPHDPDSHRFKSAEIEVTVHGDNGDPNESRKPGDSHPRILKHAPELMFGAVSPENLQWNFSLSSSLGVSQAPVSASLNPKAAVNSSYKVFHMMSIQGSVRSKRSSWGPEYDAEDAKAVWTLTENMLQKSGLPREFDFVLLVQKPEDLENIYMSVDLNADVGAWVRGKERSTILNLIEYQPPEDVKAIEAASTSPQPKQPSTPSSKSKSPRDANQQHRHSWAPENVNVRVILEHQFPQGSNRRRFSYSPLDNLEPVRYPSIRRRKSRTGLKEYGAKQALDEIRPGWNRRQG
ncbi:unnamed protein product [Alternaria alternata]